MLYRDHKVRNAETIRRSDNEEEEQHEEETGTVTSM